MMLVYQSRILNTAKRPTVRVFTSWGEGAFDGCLPDMNLPDGAKTLRLIECATRIEGVAK